MYRCCCLPQAVCTNENDILHRFFSNGDYSVVGRARATLAPAMDITKASNFERFLFHLLDGDSEQLNACMRSVAETGVCRAQGNGVGVCRS